MDFKTFDIISNASAISVLIPLTCAVVTILKKKTPIELKLIGVLLFLSGLSDLLCTIFIACKLNPNPVITVFNLGQFSLISMFYLRLLKTSFYRRYIKAIAVVFGFYAVITISLFKAEHLFYTSLFTIPSIVFVMYSAILFKQLLDTLPVPFIYDTFIFWCNAAILIYFGFNLLTFTMVQYVLNPEGNEFLYWWSYHNGVNVLKNLVFSIAFARKF